VHICSTLQRHPARLMGTEYRNAARTCRRRVNALSAACCWFHRGVERAVVANGDSYQCVLAYRGWLPGAGGRAGEASLLGRDDNGMLRATSRGLMRWQPYGLHLRPSRW
jgi:hypothetical protein